MGLLDPQKCSILCIVSELVRESVTYKDATLKRGNI